MDDAIDGWAAPGASEQVAAARRLLDAGADRNDLALMARAVAYEAVFAAVAELDSGADLWRWVAEPVRRSLPGTAREDYLARSR